MGQQTRVSIGQVKRDISELVNRVAYGGERIVLTSRGKPKAVLISVEDYERLQRSQASDRMTWWREWVTRSDALCAKILARRGGVPIDVDELMRQDREDLERRSDWIVSDH